MFSFEVGGKYFIVDVVQLDGYFSEQAAVSGLLLPENVVNLIHSHRPDGYEILTDS